MKTCVAVGAVILTVAIASVQAQREQRPQGTQPGAAAKSSYVPPRTPWGDPDIQGGYSNVNENGIPFEKPDTLGSKQVGQVDDSELAELVKDRNQRAEANAATIGGRETGAGPVHWYEHYNAKNSRAWMVVDPPDGHIPAQTPAARLRIGGAARGGVVPGGRGAGVQEGGRADSWLDRSFYDRCITRGFPGSMMPAIYGNAYDITQAPGLVAIRYEMVHETRVIRLDNTPRTGQLSHMGEARGHWEGNTLVVETTNFNVKDNERRRLDSGVLGTAVFGVSGNMTLVERFTRVDADRIDYRFTVTDPTTFTRPWTVATPMTRLDSLMFEYACHEGNYSIVNSLSGARAQEKEAQTRR